MSRSGRAAFPLRLNPTCGRSQSGADMAASPRTTGSRPLGPRLSSATDGLAVERTRTDPSCSATVFGAVPTDVREPSSRPSSWMVNPLTSSLAALVTSTVRWSPATTCRSLTRTRGRVVGFDGLHEDESLGPWLRHARLIRFGVHVPSCGDAQSFHPECGGRRGEIKAVGRRRVKWLSNPGGGITLANAGRGCDSGTTATSTAVGRRQTNPGGDALHPPRTRIDAAGPLVAHHPSIRAAMATVRDGCRRSPVADRPQEPGAPPWFVALVHFLRPPLRSPGSSSWGPHRPVQAAISASPFPPVQHARTSP